jgi:hypothetical protein
VSLFFGSNLASFNQTLVVPYEISKVNFHAENKFLLVCQKRFNKTPIYLGPKNLDTILMHWMSVKLADSGAFMAVPVSY